MKKVIKGFFSNLINPKRDMRFQYLDKNEEKIYSFIQTLKDGYAMSPDSNDVNKDFDDSVKNLIFYTNKLIIAETKIPYDKIWWKNIVISPLSSCLRNISINKKEIILEEILENILAYKKSILLKDKNKKIPQAA